MTLAWNLVVPNFIHQRRGEIGSESNSAHGSYVRCIRRADFDSDPISHLRRRVKIGSDLRPQRADVADDIERVALRDQQVGHVAVR